MESREPIGRHVSRKFRTKKVESLGTCARCSQPAVMMVTDAPGNGRCALHAKAIFTDPQERGGLIPDPEDDASGLPEEFSDEQKHDGGPGEHDSMEDLVEARDCFYRFWRAEFGRDVAEDDGPYEMAFYLRGWREYRDRNRAQVQDALDSRDYWQQTLSANLRQERIYVAERDARIAELETLFARETNETEAMFQMGEERRRLLAENEGLRAVAEAAREFAAEAHRFACRFEYRHCTCGYDDLRDALAAIDKDQPRQEQPTT